MRAVVSISKSRDVQNYLIVKKTTAATVAVVISDEVVVTEATEVIALVVTEAEADVVAVEVAAEAEITMIAAARAAEVAGTAVTTTMIEEQTPGPEVVTHGTPMETMMATLSLDRICQKVDSCMTSAHMFHHPRLALV